MVYNERSYILLCRVFDITKSYTPTNPPQPNTPQKLDFAGLHSLTGLISDRAS